MAQSAAIIDRLDDSYANTVKIFSDVDPTPATIRYLNAVGADAVAFGTREFSGGTAALAASITVSPGAGARFPLLSASYDFSGAPDLQGLVTADGQEAASNHGRIASSAVVTLSGQRVGIVGLTAPTLPPTGGVIGRTPAAADLDAVAAVAQSAIDALRAQGVDKIILSAQLDGDRPYFRLARMLSGVDVIVSSGNTPPAVSYPLSATDKDGNGVVVVETPGQYTSVGRLVIGFDAFGNVRGAAVSNLSASLPVNDSTVSALWGDADPYAVGSRASRALGQFPLDGTGDPRDGNVLGYTGVFLNGRASDVRSQETNLGNLSADANLRVARQALYVPGRIVAITDAAGLGASIGSAAGGPPAGNPAVGKLSGGISQLDIEAALPANRGLSIVTVSVANFVRVLEQVLASADPGAMPGSFPQISGFSLSFDPTRQAQVTDAAGVVTTPGQRIRTLALLDAEGGIIDVIVADGTLVGDTTRFLNVVIPDDLLGDGSPYRFELNLGGRTDLRVTPDLRYGLPHNPPLQDGATNFAAKGTEQDALGEYLWAVAPTTATALTDADYGTDRDARIQNLSARTDAVLAGAIGARAIDFSAFSPTAAAALDRYLTGGNASGRPALVISEDLSGGIPVVVPGYSMVLLGSPNALFSWDGYLPSGYDGKILQGRNGSTITARSDGALLVGNDGYARLRSFGAASTLIAGSGHTSMQATGGGNTVIGGSGDDSMAGGGTFFTGKGNNLVSLNGSGSVVRAEGRDTVFTGLVGPASDTIGAAAGSSGTVVFAGVGRLTFINAGAPSTVTGAAGGSATIFGGDGGGIFQGGSAGGNVLVGQYGKVTLVGGGDGDLLYANGSGQNILMAGPGNSTLIGGAQAGGSVFVGAFGTAATTVTGGNDADIIFAGTGSLVADGGDGVDLFVFTADRPGGTTVINGFKTGQDRLALLGHDPGEAGRALAAAQVANGSTTLTLVDNTRITFTGVSDLNSTVFI